MVKKKVVKKKETELEIKWTAKDFFEFLKPSKKSVFFSILLSVALTWLVLSNEFLEVFGFPKGSKQIFFFVLLGVVLFLAVGIICYTIISLVVYLKMLWRRNGK